MNRICRTCGSKFDARPADVKRGRGKYCSVRCANSQPRYRARNRVQLTCAGCSTEFERPASRAKKSKHGLYFCSRSCKDIAQRIGGIKKIQPDHYGQGCGLSSYRSRALKNLPHRCADCGFDKHFEVLLVHHIDTCRQNNKISNLVILCPTCHAVRHLLARQALCPG